MIQLLFILLLSLNTTPESVKFEAKDKAYLTYSYEDEVHYAKGVELVEKGKYKQALKELDNTEVTNLSRYDENRYLFYKGYAQAMDGQIGRAAITLKKVVQSETKDGSGDIRLNSHVTLQQAARYYYAYCLYRQKKYDRALPYLLELESLGKYRESVPFFLTQIYYQQGKDKEVQTRAELLLANRVESHSKKDESKKAEAGRYEELQRILGEIYYRQGKYAEALRMLKQVKFRQDSIGEYAYMAMGNCQVQLGQLKDAKMSYQAAAQIGITPRTKEEALYNYAMCAYKTSTALGEGIRAVTDFLKAYPHSEHRQEVQGVLCEALLKSKNYQAALNALDEMGGSTPEMEQTRQQLRYLLGTDAFAQGQMQQAVEHMSSVIAHAGPRDAYRTEALYWRAEAEYRLKEYGACIEDVNRYLQQRDAKTSPNYAQAKYLLGYSYFAQQQYAEARTALLAYVDGEGAGRDMELLTDARCRIADCYYNGRGFKSAMEYYKAVSDRGGRNADYALYQQGYIRGLLKQMSEKEQVMKELVMRYPKSRWAEKGCYEMARAQIAQDLNREAIRTYDQELKRWPNGQMAAQASLERAMLYQNLKETDNAIAAYKSTIQAFPGTDEAYQALDALQQIYVSINRLSEFMAYTKGLGKMKMVVQIDEDSLSLATAEGQMRKRSWANAMKEYQHLLEITSNAEYQAEARVGIFRCATELKDRVQITRAAEQILASENPQTALYAEASYELAYGKYLSGQAAEAEQQAMELLQSSNQHQYWLAKALILVADVEAEQGELFQAKQYLLTLQRNYEEKDDILPAVEARLKRIYEQEERETESNETTEEVEL